MIDDLPIPISEFVNVDCLLLLKNSSVFLLQCNLCFHPFQTISDLLTEFICPGNCHLWKKLGNRNTIRILCRNWFRNIQFNLVWYWRTLRKRSNEVLSSVDWNSQFFAVYLYMYVYWIFIQFLKLTHIFSIEITKKLKQLENVKVLNKWISVESLADSSQQYLYLRSVIVTH